MNERDEQVAIDTAKRAGALLRAELGKRRQITFKGTPTNLVTEMDRRAEALIIEAIQAGFPGDAILSEERGTLGGPSGRRWIIDPLDGTTNYAHGIPIFCVSIALEVDGQTRLGGGAREGRLAERRAPLGVGRGDAEREPRGHGTPLRHPGDAAQQPRRVRRVQPALPGRAASGEVVEGGEDDRAALPLEERGIGGGPVGRGGG